MPQPSITIPREPLDHFLTGLAGGALLLMFGLIMYYYDILPEQIPVHFNVKGEPDRYGDKAMLWGLSAIAIVLFLLLEFISRRPQLGNYTVPITAENAPRQYRNMQRMTRTLLAFISLFLVYITYAAIQTALDNADGLSMWVALLSVAAIIGCTAYFLYRAKIMER